MTFSTIFLFFLYLSSNYSHSCPISQVEFLLNSIYKEKCSLHFQTFKNSVFTSVPSQEFFLASFAINYQPYIKDFSVLGFKQNDNSFMLHNPVLKIKSCIIFLLLEPDYKQILETIRMSGYGVNLSGLFLIFLTKAMYFSIKWGPELLVTDTKLVFIIEGENTVGMFCYFCAEKIQYLSQEVEEVQQLENFYFILNINDLGGQTVFVGNVFTKFAELFGVTRLDKKSLSPWQDLAPIEMLSKAYNFSIQEPEKKDGTSVLFSPPVLQYKYSMLIYVTLGIGEFYNETKQVLLNNSQAFLIYCVNYAEVERPSLLTIFYPFTLYVWLSIFLVSLGIVLLAESSLQNSIFYFTIFFREGPYWNFILKRINLPQSFISRSLIIFVITFWCIISSNMVTPIYEGFIASEIIAPLPHKVLQTFGELLLAGFVVVLPGGSEWQVKEAYRNHKSFFKDPVFEQFKNNNKAFELIDYSIEITKYLLLNPGTKSTYQYVSELESTLEDIKGRKYYMNISSVECYCVPEVYEISRNWWMFLFHMSDTFTKGMSYIAASGVMDFRQKIRNYFRVLEKKLWTGKEKKKSNVDEESKVLPLNLRQDSKLVVFFIINIIFFGISCICVFCEILLSSRQKKMKL